MRRLRDRLRAPVVVVAAGVVLLAGPVTAAVARFTSISAISAPVSTVQPAPATGVTVSACGSLLPTGVLADQLTVSWTAPSAADVTGYAIYVAGIQIATAAASQTSWTDGTLLSIGTVTFTVRALYGSAQSWYADSAGATYTFQLLTNMC